MNRKLGRLAAFAAVALTAALAAAAPASASHLQGGFFTAGVTATGRLQGTVTWLTRNPCPMGVGSQSSVPWTLTAPTSEAAPITTTVTATRCLTNASTYVGSFDIPLDTSTFAGGAPDGNYELAYRQGNRVSGIVNLANSSSGYVRFAAQVHKTGLQASGAPNLGSIVATGVGIGSAYSQNLNASDPDGGALSYQTLLKPSDPDAPDSDVVNVSGSGQVTIPASTTAGFTGGQYYVYKLRVTDSQGDYAERDVLLKVAASNHPPAIAGLSDAYSVAPGGHLEVPFTGADQDGADTVTLSASGLPAWASLQTTPGNPASAKLVLDPPANVAAGSFFGVNLDAVDDSTDVPLTASANVRIAVSAITPAAPRITSAPAAVARVATFEFAGDGPFECRVDANPWAACASPFTVSGVADGTHTFEVRQGGSDAAAASFALDTLTPAAPKVLAGPSGVTDSRKAKFEFAGEPGGTFECRLDSGAWAPCTSPKAYAGLDRGKHVFQVRQTDAAGNVGAVATESFTVVGGASLDVNGGKASSKLTPVLASTVSASSHSAQVGCRIAGARITSCTVKAYVTVNGKKVLIGTGRASGDGGSRLAVHVKLNARGRELVNRAGGVKASFTLDARVGDAKLAAKVTARMLPSKTLVVPASSFFAVGSGALNAAGSRYLRGIVDQLDGVKTLTCIGYTDSTGDSVANWRLGKVRAESVCGALRKLGVKAQTKIVSAGEARPRATNATEQGRALNRRVELDLDYR